MRNRKLDTRNKELEEELDRKQCARRLAKDLSNIQKLQIEFIVVKHFKDFTKCLDELTEYGTMVYVKCTDNMIKLMIERRVKVVVLIFAKTKALCEASQG